MKSVMNEDEMDRLDILYDRALGARARGQRVRLTKDEYQFARRYSAHAFYKNGVERFHGAEVEIIETEKV